MIREIEAVFAGATSHISCLLLECEPVTQWRFLPEKVNIFDAITALGAIGSFLAVFGAAIAIFQSAKARNLSTVIELTRQLAAEREKAQSTGIYGMENDQFHAYQMVHLVEQASMIVNSGWVSGQSREFLLDWLRLEIPSMTKQAAYQAVFNAATGQELCELFKLRDHFEMERKQIAHFDRIYERSRSRSRKSSAKI